MPPIRTEKKNSVVQAASSRGLAAFGFKPAPKEEVVAAAARAKPPVVLRPAAVQVEQVAQVVQDAPKPKPRLPKPLVKGVKQAAFGDSRYHWDGKYHKIVGTSTRKIIFGRGFKLADNHIDDILFLGPKVCDVLTEIHFQYVDTDYDAHNDCLVTDEGIKRLARGCRNLKKISLPGGGRSMGDEGLIHLLTFCHDITHLEFSGGGVTEAAFQQMAANSDLAPNLKKLRLDDQSSDKNFMRGMREFGRSRPTLPIELVHRSHYKKYDSWYMSTSHTTYTNGRKVSTSLPVDT
ncbi:uncharacterized protein J4E92_007809 [Alternaria infectoria]|uniref:uncharacterized protein n=1 Tax=Alternaria infectoria TaxID=45303 RepID=UPI002220C83E|nr:uncharacterized protein J4E92_007809 [Alternaria infectoria]KAI4923057.1 hypothetical protein J4E92_007809 [Alternaria infectoria]